MGKIETYQTDSSEKGPNLLIFGALHGNEPAGTIAINDVREKFDSGQLRLLKGRITWVPVANPEAFKQNKRFLEEDLNRIFRATEGTRSYEARLANELGMLIENANVFLDIHTTAAPGPTCVFIDFPTNENVSFAKALGMEYALTGWPKLYATNLRGLDSFDTTRYAFEHGKIGLIIECGQHQEPTATPIAANAISKALAHFGMIRRESAPAVGARETITIRMNRLEYKEDNADAFTKAWGHLELIPRDTIIATRASGEKIVATEDVIMLLPKHEAVIGQEWFYLGSKEYRP